MIKVTKHPEAIRIQSNPGGFNSVIHVLHSEAYAVAQQVMDIVRSECIKTITAAAQKISGREFEIFEEGLNHMETAELITLAQKYTEVTGVDNERIDEDTKTFKVLSGRRVGNKHAAKALAKTDTEWGVGDEGLTEYTPETVKRTTK